MSVPETPHVIRTRVRASRGPRPSPDRSAIFDADDMNVGYFALTAAMVSQAQLDLNHRCWPSGCKAKNDCQRRKLTARQFLTALRAERSPIWSDWLALAAARANVPRTWRS